MEKGKAITIVPKFEFSDKVKTLIPDSEGFYSTGIITGYLLQPGPIIKYEISAAGNRYFYFYDFELDPC